MNVQVNDLFKLVTNALETKTYLVDDPNLTNSFEFVHRTALNDFNQLKTELEETKWYLIIHYSTYYY